MQENQRCHRPSPTPDHVDHLFVNHDHIARRFDKHAGTYDNFSLIQKDMSRECMDILRKITGRYQFRPKSILELGSGTGHLTSLLCKTFPDAYITAIDCAPSMIKIASDKLRDQRNLELLVANIEDFKPQDTYDLIISNATIQWLSNPKEQMRYLNGFLTERSVSLHLTFGPKTFQEIRHCMFEVVAERNRRGSDGTEISDLDANSAGLQNMVTANSASTWKEIFTDQRLRYVSLNQEERILTYTTALSLLESIRKTGASYTTSLHLKPSELIKAIDLYDNLYACENGVTATYEIIKIVASGFYKDIQLSW